jgi:hypothetical protein
VELTEAIWGDELVSDDGAQWRRYFERVGRPIVAEKPRGDEQERAED